MLRILLLFIAMLQMFAVSAQYIDTVKVGNTRTYQALGACQNSIFIWNYNQQDIDTKVDTIAIAFDKAGVFELGVTEISQSGCQGEMMKGKILVIDDKIPETNLDSISIPNVFTPNDDGRNDVFHISVSKEVKVNCSIYNRWGGLIHTSTDATNLWNGKYKGKNSNNGYYYYSIELIYNGKQQTRTGFVSLQN